MLKVYRPPDSNKTLWQATKSVDFLGFNDNSFDVAFTKNLVTSS